MPETITIQHTLTEDDEAFIDFVTGRNDDGHGPYADVFSTDCVGYWLQGIDASNELGWLGYEFEEEGGYDIDDSEEERHTEAIRIWRGTALQKLAEAGGAEKAKLPERYFRLNRETAIKALIYGLGRWGAAFSDGTCDYNDYDVALQMALLGEIRYG